MKQISESNSADFLQKDSTCLLILTGFVFVLISPVIYWGIPDGFDLPQHFQFAITYYDAIKSGDFFLSWSANTNYGFGDIGLRFYPPLAHYLLAFTQLLTGDWVTTSWLNILFWMLIGSFGSYFLAKEWLSPQNSLWVGILYTIAPYHLSQIYQYFLYSEFAAAGILPFCFLFLGRVCRNGKLRDSLLLGFFTALLILTHIPTTIAGIICLGLYALLTVERKKINIVIPKLILAGIFTLSMTSFYWIKLLTEMSWLNHYSPQFSSGLYDYRNYFFPFFLSPNNYYFIKQMYFRDFTSLVALIFILPLIIAILLKFRQSNFTKKNYSAVAGVGLFAFFMSSVLSSFLWDNLFFLQKIQFPFRWLSVATLLGVLGFVMALKLSNFQNNSLKYAQKYALVIFIVFLGLFNLTQIILPAGLLTKADFAEKINGVSEKESFDCWWTIWAKPQAFTQKEKVVAENRVVKINNWNGENREFTIEAGEAINARIATFYYPHWQATVNGENVRIELNSDGTMLIPVPKESARISLFFNEPYSVKTANIISIISWVLLLLLGLLSLLRFNFDKSSSIS